MLPTLVSFEILTDALSCSHAELANLTIYTMLPTLNLLVDLYTERKRISHCSFYTVSTPLLAKVAHPLAVLEIYKIFALPHRSELNIQFQVCPYVCMFSICLLSTKFSQMSSKYVVFPANVDDLFSEFPLQR